MRPKKWERYKTMSQTWYRSVQGTTRGDMQYPGLDLRLVRKIGINSISRSHDGRDHA